jgi:hypothetical protein
MWAGFSTGWFIVDHQEGTTPFCSGSAEVGAEITLWVHPDDATDGRLTQPTFTVLEAGLWLVVALLSVWFFTWAWLRMRASSKRPVPRDV